MKTANEIQNELSQYYGTEGYRFNSITKMAGMVYTDGVKAMADLCGAWWLVDAIASHQPKAMKDPMLRDMQFWTLKRIPEEPEPGLNTLGAVLKTKNGGKRKPAAILICERDSGDVAIKQELEYTDFPLDEIKIWLEAGGTSFGDGVQRRVMVAMLPSER